ncbi:titin isoform X2 [Xyrichtys novacula]|uniref:Titin isoform X2 n=1 Tax=Xyrichtys novacula TaxID=13765 RepID=A0AAV1GXP9_XYRNO|nr:titin isoform X2 [Xyrichtys novacula]
MSWVEKEAVLRVILNKSFNHEEETAPSDIIAVRPEQVQSLSRMALLDFMFILLLLFEVASSRKEIHRVYQPGQDVILPCDSYSSRGPQCSNIEWLYNKDSSGTINVVSNGKVDQSSRRAARMNVNTNCSLVIRQTTAEDFGLYTCRPFDNDHRFDVRVYLSHLNMGSSQKEIHRFYQPGQYVTLPCDSYSSRGPQCSDIGWLYNRDSSGTKNVVSNGKVDRSSRRAARLNVNTNCSLVIRQTTAEDVGLYTCRPFDNDERFDVRVYLSHLNILSLVQTRDDEVTLECSLLRYERLPECRPNALRWVDDTGTELREGVSKLNRGTDCFYRLTVKRQSGNNRRYVCQYVNKENHVAIQAEYTPVFTGRTTSDPDSGTIPRITSGTLTTQEQTFTTPGKPISSTGGTRVNTKTPASTESSECRPLSYIMLTLRVLELICISIITVKVYRLRGSIKPLRKDSSVSVMYQLME